MFLKKVIVQIDKNGCFENRKEMKLSRSLCKQWNLKNDTNVSLQFGSLTSEVMIVATTMNKVPTLELSPQLACELGITLEIMPIHCLYIQEENTLKLGPIIACVTNQMYHEELKFGSNTTFFEEMAQLATRNHIFFYVKPLVKYDESFTGYTLHHDQWEEGVCPKPGAVYNRVGSRAFEETSIYKKFISLLEKQKISFFNHCFLDKWEIHEALSSFPEMAPYLPHTTIFEDYDHFAEKLTIYDRVFVKPASGSQGRQILRIEKTEEQGYIVYYSSLSQQTSTAFKSSYLLYKRLKERLNKKLFIVQQGIDLIQFEGERPLDFRILCIKGTENLWKVVSSVARISSKEKIVSNLAQGGEQKRPFDVLLTMFDEKLAKQYIRLMGELAIEVANLITESHDGLFAELGIDIGLDKNGKLWIIEVNSKPSKMESDDSRQQFRPSTKALLTYLAYLSGYPLTKK